MPSSTTPTEAERQKLQARFAQAEQLSNAGRVDESSILLRKIVADVTYKNPRQKMPATMNFFRLLI